jgi:hypothetical protein
MRERSIAVSEKKKPSGGALRPADITIKHHLEYQCDSIILKSVKTVEHYCL